MSKEIRSKTLAMAIAFIMVTSVLVILNTATAKYEDMTTYDKIPGVNAWQGANWSVANETNATVLKTSTTELYYNHQVEIEVNHSLNWSAGPYFLYYPVYTGKWGGSSYNLTWKKYTVTGAPDPSINGSDYIFGETGEGAVTLNVSGLWLIDNDDIHDCHNLSRMNATVPAWFWVNTSKEYTVTVSDTTFPYDSIGEITIDVDHGTDDQPATMIDIRADNGTSVFVKNKFTSTGSLSDINKNSSVFKWAGNYTVYVYYDTDDAGTDIYYFEGSDYHKYYSTSYGQGSWNSTATYYTYDLCGPWDPPEYNATPVKIVVESGVPTLSIPEANATQYWSFPGEVNISVKDYEGNNITFSSNNSIVILNDDKENVTANFTIKYGAGYIRIYPKNQTGTSGWGKNGSHVYGNNGTWRAWIRQDKDGDGIFEWNGTAKWKVTRAPGVQIKLIDDDGGLSTDDNDGVIPKVPSNTEQPITIQFQVISRNHDYLGSGDFDTDARNITLSGNALLLDGEKTLYEYNQMLPGSVYVTGSTAKTWHVNITPTMALNGGEITISVDWGSFGTATQTISIGGSKLNGTIVSISPSEFVIGQNVTLTVTVTGPTGYPYPNAYVALYFINDSGGLEAKINETNGGGTTSGEYTFFFNVSQQTDNQSQVTGWGSDPKAPRYIAAYVELPNVGANPYAYGYAYAKMKPKSDFGVEISKDTFMAGQLTDFWINVSIVNNDCNKTDEIETTGDLHVEIYNESGENVTSDFVNWGWSLSGDDALENTDAYALEPGTYTIFAYNNTHNSEGCNATFTVVPVTVTCDKSEFIYMYDDNISATFTVTWQGQPVGNGTLRIKNITDAGTYNKTWVNYTGNSTIDVEVVNGVVTIHNITANYLPTNSGIMYIDFAYQPEGSTVFANATGRIPVKVPDATPDPSEVALNEPANVEVTVTGRGEPLEGVFVSIDGPGNLAMNGTTGADGTITFSFVPTATGDINIKVYNRSTGSKITVTAHTLNIDAPAQANEGETFTVTVKDENGNAVSDAQVTFSGTGETKTTDSSGQVTFTGTVSGTLPYMTYKLTATKAGYKSDEESITIVGVPQLYIEAPATVDAGSTFTVKVTSDTGAVYGVDVTFNGETKTITGPSGVTFTAPSSVTKETSYPITATKDGYKDGKADITVKPAGVPGFELITLIAAIGIAFILLRRRH